MAVVIISCRQMRRTFAGSWVPFAQFQPTLANWMTELQGYETQHALLNSIVVSVGSTLIILLVGTLAAYALAMFRFRRIKNQDILIWFLSQRVMPPVVFVVPFFIIMREIFREIPRELTEAALVDGANRLQVFYRIFLPLSVTGLAAVGIICLAFTWNEFLMALTLSYKHAIVMPVLIVGAEHTRGVEFWYVAVRTLLTMSIPVAIALFAQRYVVRGLTMGAIKG